MAESSALLCGSLKPYHIRFWAWGNVGAGTVFQLTSRGCWQKTRSPPFAAVFSKALQVWLISRDEAQAHFSPSDASMASAPCPNQSITTGPHYLWRPLFDSTFRVSRFPQKIIEPRASQVTATLSELRVEDMRKSRKLLLGSTTEMGAVCQKGFPLLVHFLSRRCLLSRAGLRIQLDISTLTDAVLSSFSTSSVRHLT